MSLDTETEGHSDLSKSVPQFVLGITNNGQEQTLIVRSSELADWVLATYGVDVVCHNAAFDWWVVYKELLRTGHEQEASLWKFQLDKGRIHDTMLADFLFKLAVPGRLPPMMRDLGELAAEYCGLICDKSSPYRRRFGELLLVADWDTVDPGFFDYAAKDAYVTWKVASVLYPYIDLVVPGPEVLEEAKNRWGVLTEALQVRAAIVLADIGHNGFAVDRSRVQEVRMELSNKAQGLVQELLQYDPPIFTRVLKGKKAGQLKTTSSTGIPSICVNNLREHLRNVAKTYGLDERLIPKTEKTQAISTALESWRNLASDDSLIESWGDLVDTSKLLQFVMQIGGETQAVHTDYNTIVKTGRTSARNPNIQQMPKEKWFRSLFVARPGHKLIVADYSAIELVTLASVLERRYGKSVLADVLRSGRKPHDFTASLMMNMPYEEFLALKEKDKDLHTKRRQAAKAINFGVPGGLGAKKLIRYAKTEYKVDLTLEEASRFRDKLIHEVYPELADYLTDTPEVNLARNLGVTVEELVSVFKPAWDGFWWCVGKVIAGRAIKADGTPYSSGFRQQTWNNLAVLNHNPLLADRLFAQMPGDDLRNRLFGSTVTTLTGRVRARVDFGESRNTPFQGLAADGAKTALWELWKAGYKIVAFVHDEIVIEVPEDKAEETLPIVVNTMQSAMASVLGTDLPVGVEACISDCWTKG